MKELKDNTSKTIVAVRRVLAAFVVSQAVLWTLPAQVLSGPTASPRNRSLYIPMRDGVAIALDLWLPADLKPGARIPALMRSTRYWRARDIVGGTLRDDTNFEEAERCNKAGYALVLVDARGSGASFGFRPYELNEEETKDYGEVVDWIVKQPWSNGRVGAYGVSYSGNTAEMLTVNKHPAVKAVAPLFNDFDNFGHLVFPGGLLCTGFIKDWADMVRKMDLNDICGVQKATGARCDELKKKIRGVKPVDGDRDGSQLSAAVRGHQRNTQPYEAALAYDFRDDPFGPMGVRNVGYKRSPAGHLRAIQESGTAFFIRVGWQDAATVNGTIGRYCTIGNPQRVYIGPWDHGAINNADPFMPQDAPVEPSQDEQLKQMMAFFDAFLADTGAGSMPSQISYYTLGEGKWKDTKVWPPEGFTATRWFFADMGKLTTQPPGSENGSDTYTVNFEATTGKHNRWYTNGGAGDVVYPDRAEEDKKLLTYTSDPVESDTEITGHPLVTLYVASTHPDGALFAYLEDVARDGSVTYITEGELRAIMRKPSPEKPPYKKFGPYRSERRADAMPLIPGEITEITFELWATSVLIKKDHRIRVAIAGADKDSFARYPRDGGTPALTIARNRSFPSQVVLPIKRRPE